jgi:uncharacterized membrane protein (UPF0127 family)
VTDEPWHERLAGLHEGPLDGGLTVHVARSYRERRRGLAKMAPLPDDHALHILKCNSVHTFGMRFALDLVWLARDGRVLRVDRDVAPRRMTWCLRARSVVETCAGQGNRFADALADGV